MTQNQTHNKMPSTPTVPSSASLLGHARGFCCLLALITPHDLMAQLSTATMFGTITDSTGALVPNAKVTLVQTETNFTRIATTKADGSFREEFLPVGPYKVTAAAPGFK